MFDGKLTSEWSNEQDNFIWEKNCGLNEQMDTSVHGINGRKKTGVMKDRLKCTIKAMYHLKDQLLAVDRQYMFQSMAEIEAFLATKSL
eukprot:3432028-Ditylum_brightwellii.AAC.1